MPERTLTASDTRLDALADLIAAAEAAQRKGEWAEALEAFERAFALAATDGPAETLASILRSLGHIRRNRGELELAAELYEAGLAVADLNGCAALGVACSNGLAAVEQLSGRPEEAETLYYEARRRARELDDDRMVAAVDQNLGILANIRGDLPEAIARYQSAQESARHAGDDRHLVAALTNLGMAYVDQEELGPAERCFDEAFEVALRAQDSYSVGRVQVNRAELYLKRQQFEQARQACDDAFGIFSRLDAKAGLGEAYKFYGAIYRETGRAHLAEVHLDLALRMAEGSSDRLLQAEVHHELARVLQEEERNRDAIRSLNQAHRLFNEMQARRELLDIDRQIGDLEVSYLRAVERWGAEVIEAKDSHTQGHSQRVAALAKQLGEVAGLSKRELTWLEIGGLLHDVGKTVVPPAVLGKAGALSQDEWELMKAHTVAGDSIVGGLELPYTVSPLVRSHHERFDGRGYPDGLSGDEIPYVVRVLSVADVYDALTSPRSYRGAFTPEKAMLMIQRDAGRGLDAGLVEAFEDSVWEPSLSG